MLTLRLKKRPDLLAKAAEAVGFDRGVTLSDTRSEPRASGSEASHCDERDAMLAPKDMVRGGGRDQREPRDRTGPRGEFDPKRPLFG